MPELDYYIYLRASDIDSVQGHVTITDITTEVLTSTTSNNNNNNNNNNTSLSNSNQQTDSISTLYLIFPTLAQIGLKKKRF